VFSGSLKNAFVWDDEFLIIDNPYIKSWDYVPKIFSTQLYEGSEMHSNYYRPVQLLSFTLDYSIWGLHPYGYHLSSLLLHIVNIALVYAILITIASSSTLAFLATLFFAISPVISSTTYYISARSDLLMALFFFLSFLFFSKYVEHNKKYMLALSLFMFIFSLLSKEMAFILPALLILELWRRRRRIKESFNIIVPYLIILLFYAGIRLLLNGGGDKILDNLSYPASIPLWRRILTDFIIIPEYLKLLVYPYGLHMERFIEAARGILQKEVIISICVIVLLLFAIIRMSRRYRLVLFGAAWFLLSLLPVLNIFPVSVFFGEGWLYVPSVGFFLILGIILRHFIVSRARKVAIGAIVALLVIYYSLFTVFHGKVWKDSISLLDNVLKYEQDSPFIHLTYNNIGKAYFGIRDYERSIEHLEKSILLRPDYAGAYNNLAIAFMETGKYVKAIVYFKKAITLNRDYITAYCNLSQAYNRIGLRDRAVAFSMAAIERDPRAYMAYCNLGYIFSQEGDLDKAKAFFTKARDIRQESYEPHYCLGAMYIKMERFEEALEEYEKALRLGLRDSKFYNELAFLYLKNNRVKEAREALLKSIDMKNDQAEAHNHLGNLYSMFGLNDLAVEEYEKALEYDPGNKGIRSNIEKARSEHRDAS